MLSPDQAKYVMLKTSQTLQQPKYTELLGLNDVKCYSCEIGLNIAAGAAIAAALAIAVATGGAALIPEVAVIAVATGLSEAVVTGIIGTVAAGGAGGGAAAVEAVISELCKAMHACK